MASKNTNSNADSSPFIQPHSLQLRIWHWLTFLFISASILTVVINSTLLSPRENVKLVQEQLEKKGVTVTDDQAFAVSHEFEEKVWEIHKIIGFGLAILLLGRVVIEFTQPNDEKIKTRLKKASDRQSDLQG